MEFQYEFVQHGESDNRAKADYGTRLFKELVALNYNAGIIVSNTMRITILLHMPRHALLTVVVYSMA